LNVKQNLNTVNVKHNLNTVNVKQNLNTVNVKQNLNTVNVKQNLNTVNVKLNAILCMFSWLWFVFSSLVYRGWISEVLILKWYQVNQYTHIQLLIDI
jgi:hypothetical protein